VNLFFKTFIAKPWAAASVINVIKIIRTPVNRLNIELKANRSIAGYGLVYHALWLGALSMLASAVFILIGAWPVALCLLTVVAVLVIKLLVVNKRLAECELLTIDQDSKSVTIKGCAERIREYRQATIYIGVPYQSWRPLIFECVANGYPVCRFAQALPREDGDELVRALSDSGVAVRYIYEDKLAVDSF